MGGLRTAEALRRFAYTGPITVIGAESWAPYNRPPLSKEVLANHVSHEAVAFEQRAATSDVNWLLATRATALNIEHNTVTDEFGAVHEYSALVIATGLRPKRLNLPNGDLAGRQVLRDLDDAISLRTKLVPGSKVVIAGSGFVGSEVAATAIKLGCQVSVVGRDSHPMLRPLGNELAAEMQRRHKEHGVNFFMHRSVVDLVGESEVAAVILDDGQTLECDVFIEAVGSSPNVEWLSGNQIDTTDGVLVNSAMQALKFSGDALQNVFAIGDVARFTNPTFDSVARRVEHWNIPTETAKRAASVIAAMQGGGVYWPVTVDSQFKPVPSFWSDQYDVHLLAFGLPALADRSELVAGEIGGDCVFESYRDDKLIGACGIGMRSIVQNYRAKFA